MLRREFVRSSATVTIAWALAGCTTRSLQEAERRPTAFEPIPVEEIELPVSQRLSIAAAGIDKARSDEIETIAAFEAFLDDQTIPVDSLEETIEEGTPILELAYESGSAPQSGVMHHLGIVAGGYAVLIDAAHQSERLVVHLHDQVGETFGEYEIRRHWAERYNAGEYSARKYANEIAVTVSTT